MHVVLKALAMSMFNTGIKPRFIFEGHAEDLPSLRQDVKVLYRKIHVEDFTRNCAECSLAM